MDAVRVHLDNDIPQDAEFKRVTVSTDDVEGFVVTADGYGRGPYASLRAKAFALRSLAEQLLKSYPANEQ